MGELIKNRYKLTNVISEGTVSTVWLAVDKKGPNKSNKNANVVVIKMLNKNYMTADIELEFDITKRNVMLSVEASKVYNQVAWSLDVTSSAFNNLPVVTGHTFTGLLMTKSVNVGEYNTQEQFYWSNGYTIS